VSEKLMNGLVTTKRELEAGLADAEAELARTEEYVRKLEELIAVGRATLHAASQLNFQAQAVQRPAGTEGGAQGTDVSDLQKRLAKDGAK
jgi:uncharacterized protein YaaN involved in tellurite resistance